MHGMNIGYEIQITDLFVVTVEYLMYKSEFTWSTCFCGLYSLTDERKGTRTVED